MNVLIYVCVIIAGALNAVQSGSNAQLARSLEKPWAVGLIVSLATALTFLVGMVLSGQGFPQISKLAATPWWAWLGGFFGAAFVASTLFFAHRLGSGLFMGLTIAAAILASIVVDHFGLVGFKTHPAGLWRLLGAFLMIAGLGLVARF